MRGLNIGVIYILSFSILSAAQSVWVGHLLQGIPFFDVVFVVFFLVFLFFISISSLNTKASKPLESKHVGSFVLINFATLGAWIFLYGSLSFIEPALTASTLYGINPLITLLSGYVLLEGAVRITLRKLVVALFSVLSLVLVGVTVMGGYSGVPASINELLSGYTLAILAGISMALVNVSSKKIYNYGYSVYQLMSLRFFILLIASFALADSPVEFFHENIKAFLAIAFFGNIAPLFLLQKGINHSDASSVAYLLLLTPLFVFFFQALDSRIDLSAFSLATIIAVCLFTFLGLRMEKQDELKR